jgi:hypothetical protein
MAVYANLYMDQGSDFNTVITIEDGLGNTFDLTGYSVRAQMRKTYLSNNKIEFSTSLPLDLTTGEIELNLTASETSAITAGRYVYDVEIYTSNNSSTIRVIEGQVIVNPQVTR